MKLKVLGSSSKGNCYLLETDNKEVLILDAGVNFKEVQKALDFDFSCVSGLLVTHEHGDHVRYVSKIAQYGVNVYASKGTLEKANLEGHRYKKIEALKQFNIGNFIILPFDTEHDAKEPLGFLIQYKPTGEKLIYATDTYYIRYRFKGVNYYLVECNYVDSILKENIERKAINKTRYTRLLESHFSLNNLVNFLLASDLKDARKVILCHLSDTNSNEKIMQEKVYKSTEVETVIATSKQEIELSLYPF